jgi:hypothetical protein
MQTPLNATQQCYQILVDNIPRLSWNAIQKSSNSVVNDSIRVDLLFSATQAGKVISSSNYHAYKPFPASQTSLNIQDWQDNSPDKNIWVLPIGTQ